MSSSMLCIADTGAQRSTNAHLLFLILVSLQKSGLRMLAWSLLLLLLLLLLMLLLGAVALAVPDALAAAVAVAVTDIFGMLGSDAFDVFAVCCLGEGCGCRSTTTAFHRN